VLGLSVACGLAAGIWVYLLVAHGGYWRTDQRLPRAAGDPERVAGDLERAAGDLERGPEVVAIVPARDEADMVPIALPTLVKQEYPGTFSVILVDDGSSDGTGEIAAKIAAQSVSSLHVVTAKPRAPGWAGKVWAMAQGLEAANGHQRYVLFTDADIAWALRELVAAAEGGNRDMVSQMALLRADTGWERVLVPAFVYFFAQLYPFRRVNRPAGRTAAAAGGCMLVRREALDQAGGLQPISDALIDDVALGQLIKQNGGRTWLGLTTSIKSIRPYDSLESLWRMVARSAYTQLRHNPLLLAGTVIGLLLIYLVPPAGAVAGLATSDAVVAAIGVAGWLLMSVSFVPMLRLYGLSPLRAVTLPGIAALYAAMTVDSARRHYGGRGGEWKGRTAARLRLLS
jgi:hopene-associated glycosyltransferase HpnB